MAGCGTGGTISADAAHRPRWASSDNPQCKIASLRHMVASVNAGLNGIRIDGFNDVRVTSSGSEAVVHATIEQKIIALLIIYL